MPRVLRKVLLGSFVVALAAELSYVAFASLGLPALLRERAKTAGFELRYERMFGLVPGHVSVRGLHLEETAEPRLTLRWPAVDVRMSLRDLFRGKLVIETFSGQELRVRALPAQDALSPTAQRLDRFERTPPAAAGVSTSSRIATNSLSIERMGTGVERIELGRYRIHGNMRLDAEGIAVDGRIFRARRIVLTADGAGISRETVGVAKQLVGRASLAVTGLGPESGAGAEGRGKFEIRPVEQALRTFPALEGLTLDEDASATGEFDIRPQGLSGTARLSSPSGIRWRGLVAREVSFGRFVTLSVSRQAPSQGLRVELLVPSLRADCSSAAFCIEAVEGLRLAGDARMTGVESNREPHELELRCERADVRIAGRTFETHAAEGSLTLTRGDESSVLLDQGAIELGRVDWRSPDGRLPLALRARLEIDEGSVSRGVSRLEGSVRAHGSDAGTLLALAPMPWLRTMFSRVLGKPYSFEASIGLGPGRFELENTRLSAGRLLVRGTHRSRGDEQFGAFLFQYGAWAAGAVFDGSGTRTHYGVDEGWLRAQLAPSP